MRKIILSILMLLLTSCFHPSNDEIQKAKDELLNNNSMIQTFSWMTQKSDWNEKKENQKSYITTNPIDFTGNILEILPIDETSYWTPSMVDNLQTTFVYSNLKDFVGVKNPEINWLTCENLSDYLKENYTWYYWNTCRPVWDENNFSVNILSLAGDEYKYEKHYISKKYGIYAKFLLETGSGMMQDELQAKNFELKAKNFIWVESADKWMKDLSQ